MSDYGFVALAFGVSWTVLAGYAVWAWTVRVRAANAWRDAIAADAQASDTDAS